MYADISGFSVVSILDHIGYTSPIIWQLHEPYNDQVFVRQGDYGNGGLARLLYIDFTGPTISMNQITVCNIEAGLLKFEQDFDGFDFGVDLFSAYGSAGIGTELIGYEFGASVISIPLQGEIAISEDLYFVIGVEIKLFSASVCYKYENGKVEFGGSEMFGAHIIIGFEERK